MAFHKGTWDILIVLMTVNFAVTTSTSTQPKKLLNCDFEKKTLCQWKQDKHNVVEWRVKKFSSSFFSRNYVIQAGETSGKSKKNVKLISPNFSVPESGTCFTFRYYMYGENVGDLSVYVQTKTNKTLLWRRSGTQGRKWNNGQAYVDAAEEEVFIYVELVFTGGDLINPALDRFSGSDGICKPSDACDFEDNYFCDYTQSKSDDSDWLLHSGHTKSKLTGPATDHTFGTKKGHYAYVEASPGTHAVNHKARMETTAFYATDASCLSFWYSMHGQTMGTLNVRLKNAAGRKEDEKPIWSETGDRGESWHRGFVAVKRAVAFKVIFEGIVGSDVYGDIAIDDVSMNPGECPPLGTCDFEEYLCSWHNSPGEHLKWNFTTGHVEKYLRFPRTDHTWNTEFGGYLYLGGKAGSKGTASSYMSPPLRKEKLYCLTVWYIMKHATLVINSQNLITNEIDSAIFNTSENTRNGWNKIRYTVDESKHDYAIVIKGEVRFQDSEISLDDIAIQEGSCQSLPNPEQVRNDFQCSDGTFLTIQESCDFHNDCPNGEEEKYCGYDCDFENLKICHWGVDPTSREFTWSARNAAVSDNSNGPKMDATLKTKDGYFLELEKEQHLRRTTEVVYFLSPPFQRSAPNCEMLFSLFYRGVKYTHFTVYKRVGLEDTEVFTVRYGTDYGMKWKQIIIALGQSESPFRIVIKTWRSTRRRTGTIAIDGIHFRSCGYSESRSTCTPENTFKCNHGGCIHPSLVCNFADDCGDGTDEVNTTCSVYHRCSFESSFCGWTQEKSEDDFDWTRMSGDHNGGHMDHTTSSVDGHFIGIEASLYNGRLPGDKAWLLSPALEPTHVCVLHLFLYMYGPNVERFSVYTRSAINGDLTRVFTLSGEVGNFWYARSVNIKSSSRFQIILEGLVGNSSTSEFDIDDVVLSPSCRISSKSLPKVAKSLTTSITPPCGDPRKWQCADKSQCIPNNEVCDFVDQCQDGSDEANCGSCDFESSMCGWQDKTRGDFVWERINGSSTASYRKPRKDHTYDSYHAGTYLLAHSSGYGYRRPAVLESPILGSTEAGCSIQFFYQQETYAKLQLRLYPRGMTSYESKRLPFDVKLWTARKSRGWKKATVSIGSRAAGFRLVFVYENSEAISKYTFAPALDDISFSSQCGLTKSTTCSHREFRCTHSHECKPLTARCDLAKDCENGEDEDDCSNFKTYDFEHSLYSFGPASNWKLYQPDSSTNSKAPDRDHTYGNQKGHYMYLQPSASSSTRDVSRLTGPLMYDSQEGSCYMGMFFHLNGDYNTTDGIKVYTKTKKGDELNLVWSANKEEGDEWKKAVVPLSERGLFRVVIEGVRAVGYRGDIAIDDISFTQNCVMMSEYAELVSNAPTPKSGSSCRAGAEFTCDGKCVPDSLWCDFNADCTDGSDEASCPSRCNFEKGMCGWKAVDSPVHWVIGHSQKTQTGADHKPGSPSGQFLAAVLGSRSYSNVIQSPISPFFKSPPSTANCKFSFWYVDISQKVTFILKLVSSFSPDTILWSSYSSTKQKSWHKISVSLPPCLKDFQLYFDITSYQSKRSLNLDDFAFEGCSIPKPTGVCEPGEFRCSDGHCIPEDRLCDVNPDCCGGSDEEPAKCYEYKKNTFEIGMDSWKVRPGFNRWDVQHAEKYYYITDEASYDHTTFSSLGSYIKPVCYTTNFGNQCYILHEMPRPYERCVIRFWYQAMGKGRPEPLQVLTKTFLNGTLSQVGSFSSSPTVWTRGEVTIDLKEKYELIFQTKCCDGIIPSKGFFIVDDVIFSPGCNINVLPPPTTPSSELTSSERTQSPTQTVPSTASTLKSITSTPESSPVSYSQTPRATPATHTTILYTPVQSSTPAMGTKALPSTKILDISTKPSTASPCNLTKDFKCVRDNNKCIEKSKVCDFSNDCSDASDESVCHTSSTCDFHADLCGWKEAVPDRLDWRVTRSSNVPANLGPAFDAIGRGSYAYIHDSNNNGNTASQIASLESRTFSSAAADCAIEFYYYFRGTDPGTLSLDLKHEPSTDFEPLWQRSVASDSWMKAIVGIGRQKSPFVLRFIKLPTQSYSGQIALDEMKFSTSCESLPAQTRCDIFNSYRCGRGACVPRSDLCNGQDDCGDGSDETRKLCEGYTRERFESWDDPLGSLSQSSEDELDWAVWNRSQPIPEDLLGVDHSTGSTSGHYLYVMGNSTTTVSDSAWLVSRTFQSMSSTSSPVTDGCEVRFFVVLPSKHQSLQVAYRVQGQGSKVKDIEPKQLIPGSYWQQVTLTFSDVTQPFQLVFKAFPGTPGGTVAIDDVTFGPHCVPSHTGVTSDLSMGSSSSSPTPVKNTPQSQSEESTGSSDDWKMPVGVVLGLLGVVALVTGTLFYLRKSGKTGGIRFMKFGQSSPSPRGQSNPMYFGGKDKVRLKSSTKQSSSIEFTDMTT